MFRFPIERTVSTMKTFAKIPSTPRMIVVKLGSSDMPWAFKIGTMYGLIMKIPVNCMNKNINVLKTNGLNDLFFAISLNFSSNVGGGWSHLMPNFSHSPQLTDISLIFLSSSNSFETLSVETHPRRTCRLFCASSVRSLDSNQIGVSGTFFLLQKNDLKCIKWLFIVSQNCKGASKAPIFPKNFFSYKKSHITIKATIIFRNGTTAAMYATCRHDINEPNKNIMSMPTVVEIPDIADKTPLMLGWLWMNREFTRNFFRLKRQINSIGIVANLIYLISLIYVTELVNPFPIPSRQNAIYVVCCDVALGNKIHAIAGTMLIITIALCRPNFSVNRPEKKFPIGWTMNIMLASQLASSVDMCNISSGFNALAFPVTLGKTIEGIASTNPIFQLTKCWAKLEKN